MLKLVKIVFNLAIVSNRVSGTRRVELFYSHKFIVHDTLQNPTFGGQIFDPAHPIAKVGGMDGVGWGHGGDEEQEDEDCDGYVPVAK